MRKFMRKSSNRRRKKYQSRYYDRKVYNIEKIKGHQPRIPQHADELKFMIEWKKKIGEEEKDSIEGWKTNKSVRTNIVVLQYMMRNEYLKPFVPIDMLDEIASVSNEFDLVPNAVAEKKPIKVKTPIED